MRKRLIALCTVIVMSLSLTSCNKDIFDGNFTFNKAIITRHNEKGEAYEQVIDIVGWKDYEGEQLQLRLPDGTVMIVNSVNCILLYVTNENNTMLQ